MAARSASSWPRCPSRSCPSLARSKRTLAPALGSAAAVADAKQTNLCALLSGVLLVGLGANAALGWWWADPAAGVAIGALALAEAVRDLVSRIARRHAADDGLTSSVQPLLMKVTCAAAAGVVDRGVVVVRCVGPECRCRDLPDAEAD